MIAGAWRVHSIDVCLLIRYACSLFCSSCGQSGEHVLALLRALPEDAMRAEACQQALDALLE